MKSEYKYILCDIEGTTTSIHFVTDVLFPYFRANIDQLLNEEQNELIEQAFQETKTLALEQGVILNNKNQILEQLLQWSLQDKKLKPLKDLQGLVWEKGYSEGTLKGHIFEDVLPNFVRWSNGSQKIAIYSSGSVQAQKLLFKNTVKGDLTKYLSHYFDTNFGSKKEQNSYIKISNYLNCSSSEILFLSDAHVELECASEAGMSTIQLCREKMKPTWSSVAYSFDEIL